MRYQIKRSFEIDAGHRVPKHESKCRNLHGHRYKIDVYIAWQQLDEKGFVMDFGKMKEIFGAWLDENWDHGLVLQRTDAWVSIVTAAGDLGEETKLYIMDDPPTAECMARHLWIQFKALIRAHGFFSTDIYDMDVVVYETPNCSARWPAP